MTRPLRHLAKLVALLALATLGACVRQGPPAPVVMGDAAPPPTTEAAPRATIVATPPAAIVAPPPPAMKPTMKPTAQAPAAPPVAAPQHHRPHPSEVVVAKGETLYMISRRYDVPLRAIIDANHLDPPFRLDAGARLVLPQTRFHVVRAGETLYAVSRLYDVDVSTLVRLNHLAAPYGITIGETLDLPASVEPLKAVARAAPASPPAAAPASAPRPLAAPAAPPQKPSEAAMPRTPAAPAPVASRRGFVWPLEGRILEAYGTGPAGTHNDGINIAARKGEAVRAAAAGVVAYAGNELRGYGNLVLIKHPGGYMTAYAHNSKLLVRRGEKVRRGQEIAKAGATGSVGAPQLHFEIRRGTHALDPTDYLPSLRASAS
jgi:murein DD-endopeptidase MepM/ murein hydrolase activator NlpD